MNDTITITKEEYLNLQRSRVWLESLEAAGVDNWDGISYAYKYFVEEYPVYADD